MLVATAVLLAWCVHAAAEMRPEEYPHVFHSDVPSEQTADKDAEHQDDAAPSSSSASSSTSTNPHSFRGTIRVDLPSRMSEERCRDIESYSISVYTTASTSALLRYACDGKPLNYIEMKVRESEMSDIKRQIEDALGHYYISRTQPCIRIIQREDGGDVTVTWGSACVEHYERTKDSYSTSGLQGLDPFSSTK